MHDAPAPFYSMLDDDDDDDSGGRSLEDQIAYERRAMRAPPSSPRPVPPTIIRADNPFVAGGSFINANAPFPRFEFVVKDLGIAVGPPTILIAMGFSGKSFLMQDLAICAATDSKLFGRFPVKQGKVLHLDYDQGIDQCVVRYRRLFEGRPGAAKALRDDAIRLVRPTLKLDDPKAEASLLAATEGYTLCVIDALRPAISCEENDSSVRQPLDMLGRVSEVTRCAFLVVHHAGKEGKGDDRMLGRGSSAIFDAAGTAFTIQRKSAGADFHYQLSQSKCRTGRFSGITYRLEDVGETREEINASIGLRLVPVDAADDDGSPYTANDRQVLGALDAGELSRADLEEAVRMSGKAFDATLKRLAETLKVIEKQKRGAKLYYCLSESYKAGFEQTS